MTVMAWEGWDPTLELWNIPGTMMSNIRPVPVFVEGAEGPEEALTLYVCDGIEDDGVSEVLYVLGYICSEVRPQPVWPHSHTSSPARLEIHLYASMLMQVSHAATGASGSKRRREPGQLVSAKCEPFTVIIKTLTGRTYEISLPHELLTVDDLKNEYQKIDGVPVDQQRLIAGGIHLEGDVTLRSYIEQGFISNGGTIHVVLKLRGC